MPLLLLCLLFGTIFGSGVQDAATYHKNSSQQWNIAASLIDSLDWKGNERVLDVGCGDGKITALIASKVPQGSVLGVDISESMVNFAACQFPHLRFEVADAAHLTFEGTFDVVVSFSTLHWVIEQEKALDGLHRALALGGKAYIITYGRAPLNLANLSEKLIKSEAWKGYFPSYQPQRVYYTPEEYKPS